MESKTFVNIFFFEKNELIAIDSLLQQLTAFCSILSKKVYTSPEVQPQEFGLSDYRFGAYITPNIS